MRSDGKNDHSLVARRAEVLALLSVATTVAPAMSHSERAWTERLRVAGARLHPWIAHRVERLALSESLPPGARRTLRAAATASVIDEMRRRAAFVRYAAALDAAAIPFVVLKGMALAYTVYPTPAARPMGDVDLWVQRDRIDDAMSILGALGWQRPARRAAYPPTLPNEAIELDLSGIRSQIELHSRPTSLTRIGGSGIDGVWDRAIRAPIGGRAVRVCSVADQLAHLSVHLGVKHGFCDGLLGVVDIALTAHLVHGDDAWREIGAAHRAQCIAPLTTLTLTLARDLLGAPVPSAYFAEAGADAPDVLPAALEQLWDRDTSDIRGLDAVVGAGVGAGVGGALGAIGAYVSIFHGGPLAPGESRLQALGTRLRYDVTGRLARYAKAFARGEFRPDRLTHRAHMLREKKALVEVLERSVSSRPPVEALLPDRA